MRRSAKLAVAALALALLLPEGAEKGGLGLETGFALALGLLALAAWLLLRAGVQPINIDLSNRCTKCDREDLFWSHRRHGEARGVQAGMIMLRE